jgi:hypothetical protein
MLLVTSVPVVTLSQVIEVRGSADEAKLLPPTLQLRPLPREAAVAFNRALPFLNVPRRSASSFVFAGDTATRARAAECLTSAVYYEAAGETEAGQQAVAQVVLNRVRHPAFPASVCGVVYQGSNLPTGCQFSFTCDGSLQREPDQQGWKRAKLIADSALSGFVYGRIGWATHYHADWVVPYWASGFDKSVQIGAHIFYQWPGIAGGEGQFRQYYSAREAEPSVLRAAALIAHSIWPAPPENATPSRILIVRTDAAMESAAIRDLIASSSASPAGADAQDISAHLTSDSKSSSSVDGEETHASSDSSGRLDTHADKKGAVLIDKVDSAERSRAVDQLIRSQRKLYVDMAASAERIAAEGAAQWFTYTGLSVRARRVVLSPAARLCTLPPAPLREGFLAWPATKLSPAELFVNAGFARDQLKLTPGTPSEQVLVRESERAIVLAVFARIAALSGTKEQAAALLRNAEQEGDALVPLYYQRLASFEGHRDHYPTLREFLPYLVRGVRPQSGPGAASNSSACGPRESAVLASAAS